MITRLLHPKSHDLKFISAWLVLLLTISATGTSYKAAAQATPQDPAEVQKCEKGALDITEQIKNSKEQEGALINECSEKSTWTYNGGAAQYDDDAPEWIKPICTKSGGSIDERGLVDRLNHKVFATCDYFDLNNQR